MTVVGWAKEVEVVEQVVEFVDIETAGGAWSEGVGFVVGGVEIRGEAAEEVCHGEVGFASAEVDRGVNENGGAGGIDKVVAAPEVAVEKAWRFVGLGDDRIEIVEKLLGELIELSVGQVVFVGEIDLIGEAVVAEEGCPVGVPGVGLRGGADIVVSIEAEAVVLGLAMKVGELLAEAMEEVCGARACFDHFHHDERGAPPTALGITCAGGNRLRGANGADGPDGVERQGFLLEHAGQWVWIELGKEASAVDKGKAGGAADASAADGLGG